MQPSSSGSLTPSLDAPLVQRIVAEFQEMPGLILSVKQASRLLGVDEPECEQILGALEKDGLLRRRRGGSYGRA